jgi:hypothetical protein
MSKAVRDPLLPMTHYQKLGKQQPKVRAKHTFWMVGIAFLLLFLSGAYFLHSEIESLKNESAIPSPLPTIAEESEPVVTPKEATPSASANTSKEGQFCGGIAAIQCSEGLTCQFDGTYPDAGGTCVKPGTRPLVIPTLPLRSEQTPAPAKPAEEMTMCTQDAMQCPDGSWVGRSGPACEFKCPGQ